MLGKILRIIFGLTGLVTGYTVARTVLIDFLPPESPGLKISLYIVSSLVLGALLFYVTGKIFNAFIKFFGKAEISASEVSFYEIIVGLSGLIVGLIVANLVAIPFRMIPVAGSAIAIFLNIGLGISGIYFAIVKKDEIDFNVFKKKIAGKGGIALDTCILIDGRIVDIIETGFVAGNVIIPRFIIVELQTLADSADPIKKQKGRRGLEVLEKLVKVMEAAVVISTEFDDIDMETDIKLLKYCNKTKSEIITLDYNLNKVAAVTGINVLNINDLANAVKKIALPGEKLMISINREGKENEQGIGYLEDGTMIIVENGKQYIGMEKEVTITSVTQTSAGRLVFSKVE